MKTQKHLIQELQQVRSTLLAAVAELDLRGTDKRVTKAMCVIEATLDAAIAGKRITPSEAVSLGLTHCT